MTDRKKKRKNTTNEIINTSTTIINSEKINLYSQVQSEYVKSYTGIDSSTGQRLKKSLKSISKEKINPNYKKQNIRQKAGFSAEVKTVARQNEKAILSGSKKRHMRTDDLGRVNDQYADVTAVDSHGNEIYGEQSQVKFVGMTPEDTHAKLISKKYNKYYNNPDKVQKIEIASDKYDGVMRISKNKVESYQRQLNSPQVKNNPKAAEKIRSKIKKEQQLQAMLKKSPISTKEAIFAVKHPLLSTAKDIARVSHNAGISMAKEATKSGAIIQGGMSLYRIMTGQITAKEGFREFAIGTVKVGVNGYIVGTSATLLATSLKESSSSVLKSLGNSNLPGVIVSNVTSVSATLYDFFSGKITAAECGIRLGETGANTLAGAAYALAGQVLIPIPIVGATIGAFVGTIISSACFNALSSALKEKNMAIERRKAIETECAAYDQWLEEQRRILNIISEEYLTECIEVFNTSIIDI